MIPIEDLTDVAQAFEDTDDNDDNDDNDGNSFLVRKNYLVMKVIYWWKLSSDESYLVMKVI